MTNTPLSPPRRLPTPNFNKSKHSFESFERIGLYTSFIHDILSYTLGFVIFGCFHHVAIDPCKFIGNYVDLIGLFLYSNATGRST